MKYTISVDCMGGDNAPHSVLGGISLIFQHHDDVNFLLFGDEDIIQKGIKNLKSDQQSIFATRCTIVHTDQIITNEMHPSEAIRPKLAQSSMRMCLDSVANNESHAAVSAGNTGAYLALARYILKTLDGISRPAIIGKIPTKNGLRVMLDLGANITCNADNLIEFAVMGSSFAKHVLKIENPSIGFVNVGIENQKGNDTLLLARDKMLQMQKDLDINFAGFVEGHGIYSGDADVFVMDGFTGNITLKASEGLAKFILHSVRKEFSRSVMTKIGGLFAKSAFKNLKKSFDPRLYNGALWIGLNGIAVKSHGSADEVAFYHALCTTIDMTKSDVNSYIKKDMQKIHLT